METQAYWTKRNEELAAAIATDKAVAQTDAVKLNTLLAQLTAASDENGGTEAQRTAIWAQIDALRNQTNQDNGWTLEVTQTRRAEWNARVKAGEFAGKNGKIDMVKVAAAERAQGWHMIELKAAIAKHNI